MSSETITRTDLTNILNQVLPPVGSSILYSGAKVSSGTITLTDDYTNYDFLVVSYFVNADRFTDVFDCSVIASNPTHSYHGDVTIYSGSSTYMSTCSFKPTDSTHLAVSNSGNNVNFVAGIVKIVGVTSHDAESGIAMDYIVEQGTDGIWKYRKWSSGWYEAWYDGTINIGTGSAMGGGYFHTSTSGLTPPSFSKSVTSLRGACNIGQLYAYVGHSATYQTYWWNGATASYNGLGVSLDMRGTWK